MKQILILSLICTNITFAQSINWSQEYHDGEGNPLFIGGMSTTKPTLTDIDGDGDFDCFVGGVRHNKLSIFFFENIGNPEEPSWHLVTETYNDILIENWEANINVSFTDIDGDGDMDMFLGGVLHTGIHYYRNTGNAQSASWELVTDQFQEIEIDISPQEGFNMDFADMDNDGDDDLLISERYYMTYYENTGTINEPVFNLGVQDYLGDYNIKNPVFVDIDGDNDYDIIGGTGYHIYHFENTGTAEVAYWEYVRNNYIDYGGFPYRDITPDYSDIDQDGDYDMFVGFFLGEIFYYENTGSSTNSEWTLINDNVLTIDLGFNSFASFCDIDGDELPEMFILGKMLDCPLEHNYSKIYSYKNINTLEEPVWEFQSDSSITLFYENDTPNVISFADIDSDGDYDVFVSFSNQTVIRFHENLGDMNNPMIDPVGQEVIQFMSEYGFMFTHTLIDIDNDNDLDMFISAQNLYVRDRTDNRFYRNTGDQYIPSWEYEDISLIGRYEMGDFGFMDEDNDGDLDLFIGVFESPYGNISYYKNITSDDNLSFEFVTRNYNNIHIGDYLTLTFYDIDNDEDKDLLIGQFNGGLNLFINNGTVTTDPVDIMVNTYSLSNYPNPFNPITTISYDIPLESHTTITIYDLIGREVTELVNDHTQAGTHRIVWNGTNNDGQLMPSGMYFYQLKADNYLETRKLLLLK